MLTAFIASLAFGAALVVFSLVSGAHGDAGGHAGFQGGAGHGPADGDGHGGAHPAAHGQMPTAATAGETGRRPPLFSIRNVSFFCLAFGSAGTAMSLIGAGVPLAVACAAGSGAVVWAAAWGIHAWLLGSQSGELGPASLVGRTASVLVPVGKDSKGRVLVALADGTQPFTAVVADWSRRGRFEAGDAVVVVADADSAGVVQVGGEEDLRN
jgi:hypothetical protein